MKFTPRTDIVVSELGYYDVDGNGLALQHRIGIYDFDSQTLLSSAVADSSSAVVDDFAYSALSSGPLTLRAGNTYMVAGFHPGTIGDQAAWIDADGITVASNIVFEGWFYAYGSQLTFPTRSWDGGKTAFFGPNFIFQYAPASAAPVPEPATLAIWGLFGSLGLVALRRRKRFA